MSLIAWIGLGQMGLPMASNLVAAGHQVRGVDVNPASAAAAQAAGISVATSVSEAIRGVDTVFTMLPEGRHVESVLLGPDGVFANVDPTVAVVDCSTIDVSHCRELHKAAVASGVTFLDAPVSGGTVGAQAGTLTIMVGGDQSTFALVQPLFEILGARVVHMGPAGCGQATKTVNNMVLGVCMAATCEGVILAERLGLDTERLFDVLSHSSGDNWALRNWYPVPDVVPTSPSSHGFAPGFTTALLFKDMSLALRAGSLTGTALPTATVAHGVYGEHCEHGGSQLDCSSIIVPLREQVLDRD